MAFEVFGQISQRRREEKAQKFRRRIIIAIVIVILILAIAIACLAILHFKNKHKNSSSPSKGDQEAKTSGKIIQMLCGPTDYKKKCEDTLTKVIHVNASTPSIAPKAIIRVAIAAAGEEVIKASNKTATFKFNKPDEKAAYDVCKTLFENSIEELAESLKHTSHEVKDFHTRIADFESWLSAVYSYQETCIDAFPENELKNKIKAAVNSTQEYVSNSLALVTQISSFLQKFQPGAGEEPPKKRRLMAVDDDGFPDWIGREERKLAVKTTIGLVPNVTVAKDGSGNYTSINDCLKALPENRTAERIYIYVKAGFYEEYVTVTKKMTNITMYGDGSQKSVVIGNKNKVDGVPTFQTATFAVLGEGFIGIAMGFKNTAGPDKHQAVALRVQADHSIFVNCRMEGYQDTLYAQAHRQFYRSCYITGTIDFIFGDAAAVFQNCLIVVRKPMDSQSNIVVTAQGRADRHETSGFVIHNCRIQPDKDLEPIKNKFRTYLGRPWKQFSRTVVMETKIGDLIHPDGWLPWAGQFALNTLYYAEYRNHGPGSNVSKRVNWAGYKKTIPRKEAQSFTVMPFLQAYSWIKNSSHVPVHYGLYN